MTKIEAAEIILKGDAWHVCDVCNGCGYRDPRWYKPCKRCRGVGQRLKLKHRYAYQKLDMVPPSVTAAIARQLSKRR